MTLYGQRKRKASKFSDSSKQTLVIPNNDRPTNGPLTRSQARVAKVKEETYFPKQVVTKVCQSTMTKKEPFLLHLQSTQPIFNSGRRLSNYSDFVYGQKNSFCELNSCEQTFGGSEKTEPTITDLESIKKDEAVRKDAQVGSKVYNKKKQKKLNALSEKTKDALCSMPTWSVGKDVRQSSILNEKNSVVTRRFSPMLGDMRRSLRLAYQNPAFLRLNEMVKMTQGSKGEEENSFPDSTLEFLDLLTNCFTKQESFFVLLLGAPNCEKSTMVCSAIEKVMNDSFQKITKKRKGVVGWSLFPIIIPAFCNDDASCLSLMVQSLFEYIVIFSKRLQIDLDDFFNSIASSVGSYVFKKKKKNKQERNTKIKKESNNTGKIKTKIDNLDFLSLRCRLKSLPYQTELEVLSQLLKYSKKHQLVPIISIDHFECLVLTTHRNRQTLLYNLFNFVHSKEILCGILGCSSVIHISTYFEKRIQSRYSLARIHFKTSSTVNMISNYLLSLTKCATLEPNSSRSKSVSDSIYEKMTSSLQESSVKDIIDFYTALDHRAFEYIILTLVQQILFWLPSLHSYQHQILQCENSTPLDKTDLTCAKQSLQMNNQEKESALTYTPTRQKNKDNLTLNVLSQNSALTPSRQKPQCGFNNFGTGSMTSSKLNFKVLPLDWNTEYHDTILFQLSFSECQILAVMAYMHKKALLGKTLSHIMTEINRIEKMSLVSGRWVHDTSTKTSVQQQFRLAFSRLLSFNLLEPCSSELYGGTAYLLQPVSYPCYERYDHFV
ncbi:uncharacterized protein LOC128882955 isoform X2 [Hylaeus volcanicus]|uniref:uncharacterized protein LOC128882955 isoform X2 n=1 Tax=Hylaeus volcanicus TaxID=313075 RepID=UPI0023B87A33|nr:uncharacterized protein LOC128882955 isoform X2 [Hylaeus volcanicus]